jgi:hypothetical protein
MRKFSQFACVDWSGAITERPPGLAVATINSQGPPVLIQPKPAWSRHDILTWLIKLADQRRDILIGLDLSFAFPYVDKGSYFPLWEASPHDAKSLWGFVDAICIDDPFLSASTLLSHDQGQRHFRHSKEHVGDLFDSGIGRLRIVEQHQRATKQANSWSCFNLVGAGQVGKSTLTGMRMLHKLGGRIPVWPFDPIPESGPVLVEIYTSIAARTAGIPANRSKIRNNIDLKHVLTALDSPFPKRLSRLDDHATDALITAAWLRKVAHEPLYWQPKDLKNHFRQQEGWTFGVV